MDEITVAFLFSIIPRLRGGARVVALGALCALVQACTFGPDVELALEVDSDDPAVVEEVQSVLAARFQPFRPSLLASVEYTITGSTIRYTFKNGAPDARVLEYLSQTPGHVRASLVSDRLGTPWFTERDIRYANVGYSNSMRVIQIRLEPETGQRLVRLTSQNLGQLLAMTLDGETLFEARINGVFGERFEVAATELEQDLLSALAVVLGTGALPAKVTVVSPARN